MSNAATSDTVLLHNGQVVYDSAMERMEKAIIEHNLTPDMEHALRNAVEAELEPSYVDVTALLREAAAHLNVGELCHSSTFTLHEAMAALELMDPKMDANMIQNLNPNVPKSVEDAVQNYGLKVDDFTGAEIVAIMDSILTAEQSWFTGQNMVQTVFTCLFLHHHPTTIVKDPVVAAYCVCVLKTCELLRMIVSRGDLNREEDFLTQPFGFDCAEDTTETRTLGMMNEAEEFILHRYRLCKEQMKVKSGTASSSSVPNPYAVSWHTDTYSELQYCDAILARLRFRKAFFQLLLNLEKPSGKGVGLATKASTFAKTQLALLRDTVCMGENALPENTVLHFINNHLLGPNPPRVVKLVTIHQSIENLTTLIPQLDHVMKVFAIKDLDALIAFFADFSLKRPHILSRSFLFCSLWQDRKVFGNLSMSELIRGDIFLLTQSDLMLKPLNPENEMTVKIHDLLASYERPMIDVFRMLMLNRARQRRYVPRMMETFAELQEIGDAVDLWLADKNGHLADPSVPYPCYFGSWVYRLVVRVMTHFLELGFELDLYLPHEYLMTYWYLSRMYGISNQLIVTVAHLQPPAKLTAPTDKTKGAPVISKGRKGKAAASQSAVVSANVESTLPVAAASVVFEAERSRILQFISRGYMRLFEALHFDGRIHAPNSPFDNEEVRFNHRFALFFKVTTPPPVYYSDFLKTFHYEPSTPITANLLFDTASSCLVEAKSLLEKMVVPDRASLVEEHATLIKLCKSAIVLCQLLKVKKIVPKIAYNGTPFPTLTLM